jgi:multidrug efflux system membrane fusion protein
MGKHKMRHVDRWLNRLPTAVGYLVVAAALLGLWAGCAKEEAEEPKKSVARPVEMVTIRTAGDVLGRELPGVVRASRRVDLAFKVAGPLVKLPVEEGQTVKKGQFIAKILSRDFKTAVDRAKALALEAEQQFQRYKDLYARNQVSKAEYDHFKSEKDVTRAQQKAAEDALADTNLKAPFAGVIAKRFVENFEEVRAKQPIVSLQDISAIEILVDVPEEAMFQIRQADQFEAQAEFAAVPGRWHSLTLKEYSTEADPKTLTYQVTLLMKQPKGIQIYSGMTATVRGEKEKSLGVEEIITIPAIAVTKDKEKGAFVWVVDENSMCVQRRDVNLGEPVGEDRVQIVDGLQSGDTVAISGISRLQEGMEVRHMPTY